MVEGVLVFEMETKFSSLGVSFVTTLDLALENAITCMSNHMLFKVLRKREGTFTSLAFKLFNLWMRGHHVSFKAKICRVSFVTISPIAFEYIRYLLDDLCNLFATSLLLLRHFHFILYNFFFRFLYFMFCRCVYHFNILIISFLFFFLVFLIYLLWWRVCVVGNWLILSNKGLELCHLIFNFSCKVILKELSNRAHF